MKALLAIKRAQDAEAKANATDANANASADTAKQNRRFENSLHHTTQRFVALKELTGEDVLCLNDAAEFLDVQKRRLYDIACVLEGINMVQRFEKNSIRWNDRQMMGNYAYSLTKTNEHLASQEDKLDDLINNYHGLLKLFREDPTNTPYSYIKHADVAKIDEQAGTRSIVVKSRTENFNNVHFNPLTRDGPIEVAFRSKARKPLMAFVCSDKEEAIEIEPGVGVVKAEKPDADIYDKLDPDLFGGLEGFVLPEQSSSQQQYDHDSRGLVQTPGRGLMYFSPLKMLEDPNSVNPSGEANSSGSGAFSLIELPPTPPMWNWRIDESIVDLFPEPEWK